MRVCLAITGASGSLYAWRLMQALVEANVQVGVLISSAAQVVFEQEMNISLPEQTAEQTAFLNQRFSSAQQGQLTVYAKQDWFAPVASGSAPLDAMVICPASGGTLSAIAHGASNNLIERAADVCLKERRKLILVPRETPLSQIHLENMLKLSQYGAIILPASPGFYHQPTGIEDLVDFVVARILDQLDLPQALLKPWGET